MRQATSWVLLWATCAAAQSTPPFEVEITHQDGAYEHVWRVDPYLATYQERKAWDDPLVQSRALDPDEIEPLWALLQADGWLDDPLPSTTGSADFSSEFNVAITFENRMLGVDWSGPLPEDEARAWQRLFRAVRALADPDVPPRTLQLRRIEDGEPTIDLTVTAERLSVALRGTVQGEDVERALTLEAFDALWSSRPSEAAPSEGANRWEASWSDGPHTTERAWGRRDPEVADWIAAWRALLDAD